MTVAQLPGVYVETLHNPCLYTAQQLDRACEVAWLLQRGRLVLAEAPKGKPSG